MRKYRNRMLLGMAFSAVVLIAVILVSDARDLADKLGDFPLWLLLPITGLKVANWILRYMEWHYFLHVIDVNPVFSGKTRPASGPDQGATIRVDDSFILWMASLPFALTPGKVAELLKALILKNMTSTPVTRSGPIIVAERLVDGIAVVLLVGIAAAMAEDSIFAAEDLSAQYIRVILVSISIGMLLLIVVLRFHSLVHTIIGHVGKLPLIGRFEGSVREVYDSSYELGRPRHLALTTSFGITAYFTDCIGFYLMLLGLGEPPATALLIQATFILGFSVVVSAISAMPGGAGGRELTIGALLKAIVGMSTTATAAAVLMIGIFQVWFGALVGLLVAIIFRHRLFPPALEAEIRAYEQREDDPIAANT